MPDDKKSDAKKDDSKKDEDKDAPAQDKKEDGKKDEPKENLREEEEKKAEAKKAEAEPKRAPEGPLPNKAGDAPFQLQIEPKNKLLFKSNKLLGENTFASVKITNNSGKRQVIKVKVTSNDIFRVRPPFAIIPPSGTSELRVNFTSKELRDPTIHFVAIYHMVVTDEKVKDGKQAWNPQAKPDGVIRIPCHFEKDDGTPWGPVVKQ
ncbi:Major sperm protein [Aphelenchoides besseyi]|nr:Major sperm protein [Aphelenchoides besseyi]KAI6208640.1 Major sperm protein [Aphelenchoides besseyi]